MKRIKLTHGTARVSELIPEETIEALNRLSELAHEAFAEKPCAYCGGSGFDPYPNHDTTMRPCPECKI